MSCIRVLCLLGLVGVLLFAAAGCILVLTPEGIEAWEDYDDDDDYGHHDDDDDDDDHDHDDDDDDDDDGAVVRSR